MDGSDRDLLDAYLKGSQEAFAALVSRHIDLVYSAGRRQTQSTALAEDVAQNVFLKLSRHAGQLKSDTTLPAWLYVATRHAAIDLLRQESRRRAREQAASEIHAMQTAPSPWSQVEPLLDAAMAALRAADRDALVHRFFADKSLREIGDSLGVSDDAAQKRVSRALEQLRHLLAKRGVAVTAAGLTTDLSAHAIETAPSALGVTIPSRVLATATGFSPAALESTRTVAITVFQKSTFATLAVLVLTLGTYQVREVVRQEHRLTELEEESARLTQVEYVARLARDERMRRLPATTTTVAAPQPANAGQPDPDSATLALYTARIATLRSALEADPKHNIPELTLLTNKDWLGVAAERSVDDDNDLRASLGRLRTVAKAKLSSQFTSALLDYAALHGGSSPAFARELQPHLKLEQTADILGSILARYTVVWRGTLAEVPARTDVLIEADSALPDADYDLQLRIQGFPDPKSPGKFNFGINSKPGPKAIVPPLARPLQP